jgi:hypothetical protein
MDNTFTFQNLTTFKLNNIEYVLFNNIMKEMVIFNILFDENNDIFKGKILELNWPVSIEIVDNVFKCMYASWLKHPNITENFLLPFKYYNKTDCIRYCLEVISFMKYIGIEQSIINIVTQYILKDMGLESFRIGSSELEYCSDLKYILLNNYVCMPKYKSNSTYISSIPDILFLNFPIDFKIEIIKRIIIYSQNMNEFKILFYINLSSKRIMELYNTVSLCSINEIYKKIIGRAITYHINHSDTQITEILINDKQIEYQDMIKINYLEWEKYGYPYKESGDRCEIKTCNVLEPIATHIAKILLNIIEL